LCCCRGRIVRACERGGGWCRQHIRRYDRDRASPSACSEGAKNCDLSQRSPQVSDSEISLAKPLPVGLEPLDRRASRIFQAAWDPAGLLHLSGVVAYSQATDRQDHGRARLFLSASSLQ
jgi:hypothetical protein